MAAGDVADGKTVAAQQDAWLCFEDEAGQTLRPPKARTWGRRGQTPQIPVSGKGSGRVSIAGLVCVRLGHRPRLIYRISHAMRKLVAARDWLHVIQLPPYAPDLNPTEHVWSHVKRNLGNLIVHGIDQLTAIVKNRLKRIQYRPDLVDAFFAHTGLSLEPQPS